MVAQHVPQEICDIVIGLLRSDRQTLNACSFVSHAWLYSSRPYKFFTVVLRSPDCCTRLERILDAQLLDASTIARCVRDVCFGEHDHAASLTYTAFYTSWRNDRRLASLLPRFTRACSLHLENVVWVDHWLPLGAADAILAMASRLVQLRLNRVVFDESDTLIRLLSTPLALSRLYMSFVSWNHRSRSVTDAMTAQRQSRRLDWRLEHLTVDPMWSYCALLSAALSYPQQLHISVATVHWAVSEPEYSRSMPVVIKELGVSEAFIVFEDVHYRSSRLNGLSQIEHAGNWISGVESTRVDISMPVPESIFNRFALEVPGILQAIDVPFLEYDLGTFISHSFVLNDRLRFDKLDNALALLVKKHPEMTITFRVRIQLAEDHLWWADAEASRDEVAAQFSLCLPKLLALKTRVGVFISFFYPDRPLAPHTVWKEVWWTRE